MASLLFFRCCRSLALLGLPLCAHGQITLKTLRTQWEQRQYADVVTSLKKYRTQPYGRNIEVDYMIATSLCRLPSGASPAAQRFAWLLQNYSMSFSTRKAIEREYASCAAPASAAAPTQPVVYNIIVPSVRDTGGSVSSKTFYRFEQEGAQVSAPVETVTRISDEEFEQRKIAFGQPKPAEYLRRTVLEAKKMVNNQPGSCCQTVYAGRCNVAATAHFLLVGARDEAALLKTGRELEEYLLFYQRAYQMLPPQQFFTVYVADTTPQLRSIAAFQHGLKIADGAIGYSFQNDLSMAAVLPYEGQGTLKHELCHLLARGNFGDIPPWLDEGMAALYEVSQRGPTGIEGLPNWRGRVLYVFGASPSTGQAWKETPRTYIMKSKVEGGPKERVYLINSTDPGLKLPIAELLAMRWDQFDGYAENASASGASSPKRDYPSEEQAYHHAIARYFALFLQQTGRLGTAYAAFRAQDPDQPAALQPRGNLLAAALGTTLPVLQQEFDAWLQTTLNSQRAAENW